MSDETVGPKEYNIKGHIPQLDLAEDGSSEPLRVKDLVRFFRAVGRQTSCPHCDHKGAWEIGMSPAPGEDLENPRLAIYQHQTLEGHFLTAVMATCPQCGYLSQISTYKIRSVLSQEGQ